MKAVTLTQSGHDYANFHLKEDYPKPTPGPNDLLVRVHATALNPIDYKMAHYGLFIKSYPIVIGCDMSGTVEDIGSNVTNYKVGDHVYGSPYLGAPGRGTFAEYCIISALHAGRKPDSLSFEDGAALSVGLTTASCGLYFWLKLPFPSQPLTSKHFILIWGGSSSVGSYAVQMATLSGLTVIAVCSTKNAEYVKSLGAQYILDYQTEDVVAEAKKITNGKLIYAFDTIGGASTNQCVKALSATEKTHLAVIETGAPIPEITSEHISLYSVSIGGPLYEKPEYIELFQKVNAEAHPLLSNRKLKANHIEVIGGLEAIQDGLKRISEGKVSGQKLIVSIK